MSSMVSDLHTTTYTAGFSLDDTNLLERHAAQFYHSHAAFCSDGVAARNKAWSSCPVWFCTGRRWLNSKAASQMQPQPSNASHCHGSSGSSSKHSGKPSCNTGALHGSQFSGAAQAATPFNKEL